MIKLSLKSAFIWVMAIVLVSPNISKAQVSPDSELFKMLKAKDSIMFDVGFNQCNLDQFEMILTDKFEFYHDKNGITISKVAFIKTLKENLCSSGKNATMRVLEKGSLEVFPLYAQEKLYGAVQTGKHSFGNTAARFTNLWLLENGEWVLSRVISYDHKITETAEIYDFPLIKLSSEELSFYLGDYKFSPDFVLSIVKVGGQLYGDAQGKKVEINPIGKHQFLDESKKMKLHFLLTKDGKVSGLEMTGPNGVMNAQKVL